MQNQEEEIKLPPKWTVNETISENLSCKIKSYSYYNEKKELVLQNKEDNNTSRKFCWSIYNKIEGK